MDWGQNVGWAKGSLNPLDPLFHTDNDDTGNDDRRGHHRENRIEALYRYNWLQTKGLHFRLSVNCSGLLWLQTAVTGFGHSC